ncbi:enoyl-CoA hydratase [Rhodococcus sp. 14-2496-1d]|uniref:enoyl-CoA hydratase/isomerase family protein n=1 Tax=Rhodococcus sp. 14-2496-1d TaxID=2023146 RepID=UPI000B9B34E4|nr:enoyl-CoA hydratase-related protein [Rhodococcus sp. 14-2496-1d]OZF25685.1 enoyl-CoA hydratase [Rhodococcus sp. 14-2496-1d]
MADEVLYDVRDGIARLTINRPAQRNAIDKAVREGLRAGFADFDADEDARVLILTGAGDRAFCAGGDLKEMAETSLGVPPPDFLVQPGRNVRVDKPIIGAINGFALAGGFQLAQSCDLVVAADTATFGITEARVGRGAPWAAPLPWLVPPRIAMEILMTAAPITAQRAYEVGLVNKVCPLADLMAEAEKLARTIAANAPLSVMASKKMVYESAEHGRTRAFDVADEIWDPVYRSADAVEGPLSFKEKREPVWTGC